MAERLACEGVTSFLGTTMSFGLKELAKAAEGFQQYEEHGRLDANPISAPMQVLVQQRK